MQNYKKRTALFLISQGITLFGSSIVQFAIVWYVTRKTSSGMWVSLLTVAAYAPQFLISFVSGVWADRFPKKRLIICADAGIALATLALALLIPSIDGSQPMLLALIIISIIRSIGTGIQSPAVNATLPLLVPEEKLLRVNGWNASFQSLIQFVAPAVAGAVLSAFSLREALFIDIVTAAVGIGFLGAVTIPYNRIDKKSEMLADIMAGLQYAKKEKFVGKILLTYGIFIFLCVPAGFLGTLFVTRYYGDSYWYMTLVEVIGFLGMMGGGLLLGIGKGFKNLVKMMVVGLVAFGFLAMCMGVVENFIFYLVFLALYGVAITVVQTAATTILQEKVNPEMQGRMFGLFGAMFSGFLPIGMVVFGPLADVVPLRALMVASGISLLGLAMVVQLTVKPVKQSTQE